ncbi:anti-sigma factor [Flavilitoribacter nigricans]|uniref:Uncharacterized protein n=1 Tax=Flavilitoribacter nigricans (strain ATCC 23147 / DSM 23189 / NBRC 102662 / NCIMB 1420 / SS-2) TaxID=1122177 RepID=A0A2D0N255_FLAN2|nr:hypothetical protein [Flavilitoribacter nigricans]PHN02611.1 hypothetical protein CRP01_30930 [Flavilitoribacter nigricans DSM 23189 = NBRC 102662]
MEKEQLYETIEAYLEGELTGEELAAFERELTTDQSLAREVALHRSLQNQLGDQPKMALRTTLDAIAKDFPESDLDAGDQPQSPNGTGGSTGGLPFWMWGLAFFLVIGGGVTWYLLTMEDETVSTLSTEDPPAEEDPATTDAETNTALSEAGTEEETPAEEPAASAATPATQGAAARPDAYGTNRELELLISDEPPSRRYSFTEGDLTYNPGFITFSGKLTTSRSVEEGFYLNLYSNQYPDNRLLRGKMTFSEVKENVPQAFAGPKDYIAAYTGETNLSPALYYGVITTGDSSIALWVGKVRVE